MILRHRPIEQWPGRMTPAAERQRSPFRGKDPATTYGRREIPLSDTLDLLDRELRALGATEAVLQVAVRENDIRLDGQVRANARPEHPGVILNFQSRYGEMSYACDRFTTWQSNLRAIAKGLEALRLVDRYGIGEGRQYTGYRAIGSGTPLGPAPAMTVEDAARFAASHVDAETYKATGADDLALHLLQHPDDLDRCYRSGARQLHPDAGGDPALFRQLTEARDLLERHAQGHP